MARVKGALMTRKRRKNILKAAKGYWGAKSKHFKMAKQAVLKSGNYAFAGRKQKKRDSGDPELTEISLLLLTTCESVVTALKDSLLSHLEVLRLCTPVTFSSLEYALSSLTSH